MWFMAQLLDRRLLFTPSKKSINRKKNLNSSTCFHKITIMWFLKNLKISNSPQAGANQANFFFKHLSNKVFQTRNFYSELLGPIDMSTPVLCWSVKKKNLTKRTFSKNDLGKGVTRCIFYLTELGIRRWFFLIIVS